MHEFTALLEQAIWSHPKKFGAATSNQESIALPITEESSNAADKAQAIEDAFFDNIKLTPQTTGFLYSQAQKSQAITQAGKNNRSQNAPDFEKMQEQALKRNNAIFERFDEIKNELGLGYETNIDPATATVTTARAQSEELSGRA